MGLNIRYALYFFIGSLTLAISVRLFILDPYSILTPSMKPTILDGDVVLVNKLYYKFYNLKRNDVICFEKPLNIIPNKKDDPSYFKRCVAISGDTIKYKDGKVYINSNEYSLNDYDQQATTMPSNVSNLLKCTSSFIIPKKGDLVKLDSLSACIWGGVILADGKQVSYENNIVFVGGLPATEYTFQHDYFFALGDNSVESYDSRYFGLVPVDNLIGKVWFVYWSVDSQKNLRWNRLGFLIN